MISHDAAQRTSGFGDPTIPGLSARDLARRAMDTAQALFGGERPGSGHRDFLIRHDMAHLDPEILRDIGLDRNAQ